MRKAGLSIFSRPQLDKDFYKRNLNDDTLIKKKIIFDCNLHDLLRNIVSIKARRELKNFKIQLKKVHTVEEAVKHLKNFFQNNKTDWVPLNSLFASTHQEKLINKSNIAAHFAASLELAKSGEIKLRQHFPFGPIYIKNNTKIK